MGVRTGRDVGGMLVHYELHSLLSTRVTVPFPALNKINRSQLPMYAVECTPLPINSRNPADTIKTKTGQRTLLHRLIPYELPKILSYASSTSLATSSSVTMTIWCVTFGSRSRCSPIHSSGGVASPISLSCGVSIRGGSSGV